MLRFKTKEIQEEFKRIHPKLQSMLLMAAGWLDTYYHENLTVTCLFRDGKGVHPLGRGADTRADRPTEKMWDELIEFIKNHATYGKAGHNIIFDERTKRSGGWTAPHLHHQVRDSTELIGNA